jgi:sulfonate transport system permease protein
MASWFRRVANSTLAVPAAVSIGSRAAFPWRRLGWTLLPVVAPAIVLLSWAAAVQSGVVSRQVLVPPEQVLATFFQLAGSGELSRHLLKSLMRLAVGFAIGGSLGLILGVAMGGSRRIEQLVHPLFSVLRQVPTIALIPALILILGIEETFKIVIVAKATFFPVALAAFRGVRSIPRQYLEVAAVHRVPSWLLATKVLVPATLPHVVAGVRTSLGRSWMMLVASELIAADCGIGQMMEMGRQMFRIDVVMVGVFLTGTIGLVLDGSVRLAERRLAPWKYR